jgi:hypothetical protein
MQETQPGTNQFIDFRSSGAGGGGLRLMPNGVNDTQFEVFGTDPITSTGNDEVLQLAGINTAATCAIVATSCYRFQSLQTGTGTKRPLVFDIAGGTPSVLFAIDGTTTFSNRMTLSNVSAGGQLQIKPGSSGKPGIDLIGTETSGHTFNIQEDTGALNIIDAVGPVNVLNLSAAAGAQAAKFTVSANTFASLAACAGPLEGQIAAVTNSTTATWGATITGGGANHVLAYCDGSAWTVFAK